MRIGDVVGYEGFNSDGDWVVKVGVLRGARLKDSRWLYDREMVGADRPVNWFEITPMGEKPHVVDRVHPDELLTAY